MRRYIRATEESKNAAVPLRSITPETLSTPGQSILKGEGYAVRLKRCRFNRLYFDNMVETVASGHAGTTTASVRPIGCFAHRLRQWAISEGCATLHLPSGVSS